MRRALVILALLGAVVAGAGVGFGRGGGLATCPKGYVGGGLVPCSLRAFFEFAPPDGAGMGTACAGTVPTGAKGEVMTFSRASTATCLKATMTAAQPGDMVALSTDKPRVMSGGAGPLKILLEPPATNNATRSQEFGSSVWIQQGTATVTADQALAPDGTMTADRVQFSACPTIDTANVRYISASLSTNAAGSVWVRGVSGSGSIGLVAGGGAYTGMTCSFVSTEWRRCTVVDVRATISEFWVGCANYSSITPNPGNTGAADVYLWGGQLEVGTLATSDIITSGSPVTRAGDVPTVAFPNVVMTNGSLAFTFTSLGAIISNAGYVDVGAPGFRNGVLGYPASPKLYVAGGGYGPAGANPPANSTTRFYAYWGTSGRGLSVGGALQTDVGVVDTATATLVRIGSYDGSPSTTQPGLYGQICVDPDTSRCR